MTVFQKVLRIYLDTEVREHIIKRKEQSFSNGGGRTVEKIERITRVWPTAELDCGHIRRQNPEENFTGAKRLVCFTCKYSD